MSRDNRIFRRYEAGTEFDIECGDRSYRATAVDYSLNGLSVLLKDGCEKHIKVGDVIGLTIQKPRIKSSGKVVWARETGNGLHIGIQRVGLMFGSINDYPLPDILIGLHRIQKTGVFHLIRGPVHKTAYLKNGDIIFAISNQKEDRLGDMLVHEGIITQEQYDTSSEIMLQSGKRHGQVLAELGYIGPKDLFDAVNRSAERTILSMFSLRDAEFMFKEGNLPSEELITLKLPVGMLVFRGIKNIADPRLLKQVMPADDAIPVFSSNPLDLFQSLPLDEKDKKVLTLVDGKRNFAEIISASGMAREEAATTLIALLSTRIIEVGERLTEHEDVSAEEFIIEEPKADTSEIEAKVNRMYEKYEDLGYYGVLGLAKNASRLEIKKAYYEKAREFHPDKHYQLDSGMKEKINTIFTYITTAYSTLSNHEHRRQYDSAPTAKKTKALDNTELARERYEDGRASLRNGRFSDAARLFSEAAYLDESVADYHYYCGIALAKDEKHREAERAIQRALRLDPFNADYHAEVGYVYIFLDMPLRAKGSFEKALKYHPGHERAAKGFARLGD